MIDARPSDPTETTIAVTSAARAAMDRLADAHGDLLFHLPGGCCDARTPVCLPAGDLELGPRDRLVGHADGVPVYEMAADDKPGAATSYEIDVVDGIPVGFSLSPGDGKCFSLRDKRP